MTPGSPERPLARHDAGRSGSTAGSAAAILALLALAVLVVAGAWRYTRDDIADNAAEKIRAEIATVLPRGLYDNSPHRDLRMLDTGAGSLVPVYRARRNGIPAAAVLTIITPDGYVGPVRLLVGIRADGRVLGVHVTEHVETPGIGAAIAEEGSAWLAAFAGRSLADPPVARWALRADGGDFDAIAGATVSSRAVVGGVRRAVQYFETHREDIFAPADDAGGQR